MAFPASLSALERRFVHSTVEQHAGLTARGAGTGEERRIVVTRGPPRDAADVGNIPAERQAELEAQLKALRDGVEPGVLPKVDDVIRVVQVLGTDRTHLQGRTGTVLGTASLAGSGAAVSVRFEGDGAAFGDGLVLTLAAQDVAVLEAARPLREGSVVFPKTLTGLERKLVHSIAEGIGLYSQSFGEGKDRYITVFRRAPSSLAGEGAGGLSASSKAEAGAAAEPATAPAAVPSAAADDAADTSAQASAAMAPGSAASAAEGAAVVRCSGLELEPSSREALLRAVGPLPEGWRSWGDRMVLCQGPLERPSPAEADRRSVAADLLTRLAALKLGEVVELRVVSLAKTSEALAVGVLGAPAIGRNPHIAVATAPGVWPAAAESVAEWLPWRGDALSLRGKVVQWMRADS